ncbi:MAG: transcription-repair coupling factor [Proteobacteria bacterium]|nr:transcription-repair coupling factor [Pseudomonadota bacterium]
MNNLLKNISISKKSVLSIAGAPPGLDAQVLADLVRAEKVTQVVFVARDGERQAALADAMRFFAPELPVIVFPAWDCLPYDRVSPNQEVVAARMAALTGLAKLAPDAPVVVIATVNAVLLRVPPRVSVLEASYVVRPGEPLRIADFTDYLVRHGYARVGTVREPGEFAVRGGIIDVFSPGALEPVRLDLFGDDLEAVRTFDPLTQVSRTKLKELRLEAVGEFPFDQEAIARFRNEYRQRFGNAVDGDQLYQAVSEGRRHAGMEHWLPLFHDCLSTLFDYVPGAAVALDHLADDAAQARFDTIADAYNARQEALTKRVDAATVYRALPPESLYLTPDEWHAAKSDRATLSFSQFRAPQGKHQTLEVGGAVGRDFAPERAQPDVDLFSALLGHIRALQGQGRRVVIANYTAGTLDRTERLLETQEAGAVARVENWQAVLGLGAKAIALAVLPLEHGFVADGLAVLTEQDILGDTLTRRSRRSSRKAETFLSEVSSLGPGDFVVHVDHGIGRYEGLQTLEVTGKPHDCVALTYADNARLFVPVENIEVLSRYGGAESSATLDRLGGTGWQSRRAKLKKRLKDMAEELIKVAAARVARRGLPITPPHGAYEEFCGRFPYELTEDQQTAMSDVIADLGSGRPMDRLICGDVGFGKTEVALRSTFVAAISGHQVAVVVPTTLLARQHYETFRTRFSGLPVKIGQLSRMVTGKQAAETKQGLVNGQVDIVIGTHALLAKDVKLRDLGLLIVDEEQHFGVVHKERLKRLRNEVHVLTMTATPIPRTLQMAMSGLRELSLIATPPVDRLAVRTFIMPFDPVTVREALLREHFRGGQSFYVCPRIADLGEAQAFLREQVPEVKFAVAHGQMNARDLDEVMQTFYDGGYDVLISTNIVESGLDVPSANTMIIHRADMFGLAQLYQLRGRIGRSKVRAYAYLTVVPGVVPTAQAQKRLEVMQTLDQLGAGFTLASHDLDIRGAGNLLGEEQSGHIREVGIELFQEMLEEAVATARHGTDQAEDDAHWSPQINLGTSVLIPERFVEDLDTRLGLYRRLSRLETSSEIDAFGAELIDRFGELPTEVEHLLDIVKVKAKCRVAGIEKLDAGPRGASVVFRKNRFSNPAGLVEFISRHATTAKLRPDHTLVYGRDWAEERERIRGVDHLVSNLAAIAAQSPAAAAGSASAA